MTFGPRGTRASVGLPGTGMRYEKTFGRGGKMARLPQSKLSSALMLVICAVVALLSFGMNVSEPNVVWILIFIVAVIAFIITLIIKAFPSSDGNTTDSYTNIRKATEGDCVIRDLADTCMVFYLFLHELDRTPRCRRELDETPGMENVGAGSDCFTISPKLAFLVFFDLRDVYERLGHNARSLHNLEGIGYAMLVLLIICKDTDFVWEQLVNDPAQTSRMLHIVEDFAKTDIGHVTIAGHENELRFALIFGQLHHEQDWVNRYATLLYRWASLVAKADGRITEAESAELAAIMKVNQPKTEGSVRVSGSGEMPQGEAAPNAWGGI